MNEPEQLQFDLDDVRAPAVVRRYRRKPSEPIRAAQLSWAAWSDVCDLLGPALLAENPDGATVTDWPVDSCGEPGPAYIQLFIRTAQNQQILVRHGEWILPDKGDGRFYPVAPDIFEATYEPVL